MSKYALSALICRRRSVRFLSLPFRFRDGGAYPINPRHSHTHTDGDISTKESGTLVMPTAVPYMSASVGDYSALAAEYAAPGDDRGSVTSEIVELPSPALSVTIRRLSQEVVDTDAAGYSINDKDGGRRMSQASVSSVANRRCSMPVRRHRRLCFL